MRWYFVNETNYLFILAANSSVHLVSRIGRYNTRTLIFEIINSFWLVCLLIQFRLGYIEKPAWLGPPLWLGIDFKSLLFSFFHTYEEGRF